MIKVAIVEDNTAFRKSLRRIIESKPKFTCVAACATGGEALEIIPRNPPEVVLMDLQLPDFSGVEVIKRLKAVLPELSIVVLTVYSDAENIFEALRAGACGYLLKRSTSREILEAIGETNRGGSPMTSEIARKVITTFRESNLPKATTEPLAPREKEILDLLAQGYANKEIADELALTVGTVCWYLHEIYRKLHVQSRVQAINKFRKS